MIANQNLLERRALIGGADVYIHNSTGSLENVFENCNSLEITAKGDSISVTEKGAEVLSIPKPLTCTFKLTSETTTFSTLALALGSAGFELTTESDNYYQDKMFEVTDADTMAFTLDYEATSAEAFLVTQDKELAKALTVTLDTTKKIATVTSDSDVAVGDYIRIRYNAIIATGKMYQFKVPTTTTNGSKTVYIDAISVNRNSGEHELCQIEIYKVNVNTGITLTMSSDKASSFDIEMTVLADYNKLTDEEGSQFFRYKVLVP